MIVIPSILIGLLITKCEQKGSTTLPEKRLISGWSNKCRCDGVGRHDSSCNQSLNKETLIHVWNDILKVAGEASCGG